MTQVHFPDVRIEYEDADGRWDHDDVEVVTVHYRGAHGAAAARSGFSCYRRDRARRSGGGSSGLGGLAEELLAMNFDDRVKAVARIRLHGAPGALPGARHAARRRVRAAPVRELRRHRVRPQRHASSSTSSSGADYATACGCLHNRARLYHVHHKPLYRAIGEPHSRYRRPVSARQAIDRLMLLDARHHVPRAHRGSRPRKRRSRSSA